jgi:hypothetical protein
METFKNNFQEQSVGLQNLPDCSMYNCKLHIHSDILFILHRSKWIKNLNMEPEKMFVCYANEGTKESTKPYHKKILWNRNTRREWK